MTKPSPDSKLRILVCDKYGQTASSFTGYGRFDITNVNSRDKVIKAMDSHPIPYFSLIVYSHSQVNEMGSAKTIAMVRSRDPFMPQMIYGPGAQPPNLMKAARAGCIYYAGDKHELKEWIGNIFRLASHPKNLTVVKLGGSSFDFDRHSKGKNLDDVCKILISVFRDRPGKKTRRDVNRILLTVGAGQFGDIIKEHRRKYFADSNVTKAYSELLARVLYDNLRLVYVHMGEKHTTHINPGAFYMIGRDSTRKKIPLFAMAPHYILARDSIPLQDSDTHTIALAEFYGAERVVLIKRTDGIYNKDPYRGFRLDPSTGSCASYGEWKFEQEGNERHEVISIDKMLSDFSREGTGPDGTADGFTGHLIEDSALEYMMGCQYVKEISIVHIAPEEMHYHIGGNTYRHVVTGEELILPPTGWKGILEQSIRDAFNGKAKSKIVRE